jgi:DNA-binding NtrC family response regulator
MSEHAVLFVDDEGNILKAVQRLLRNEPWEVLTASRGSEALEILERTPTQVVVSDQRMPEMSGVDLLQAIRERRPNVVRMMLTGYTEMNVAVEAINRGEIFRLITKPWNDEELKATLRQAFDHFDLKTWSRRSGTAPSSSPRSTRSCGSPTSRRSAPWPRPWMPRTPTPTATPSGWESTRRRWPASSAFPRS